MFPFSSLACLPTCHVGEADPHHVFLKVVVKGVVRGHEIARIVLADDYGILPAREIERRARARSHEIRCLILDIKP